MPRYRIGWDVGGAHVKAAVVNEKDEILGVFQEPAPLWRGMDRLDMAVNRIRRHLPESHCLHVLTMTGELVDLFDGRDEGVEQIIQSMIDFLPESDLRIYAGTRGFVKASEVNSLDYQTIASANWLASATFAARKTGNALLVDVGSTTTDILLIHDGQVLAQGFTDYQRLLSHELIYTGIVRTPVMALTQTAVDSGKEINLMAEYFATMADVYRVTGELNEQHDQCDTADGGEKSVMASARRLSRMVGCDFKPNELTRWRQFADNLRNQQLQKIQHGCELHGSRRAPSESTPLIGAGIGRFLVRQLARNLDHAYLDLDSLFVQTSSTNGLTAADCAPAAAVACLLKV